MPRFCVCVLLMLDEPIKEQTRGVLCFQGGDSRVAGRRNELMLSGALSWGLCLTQIPKGLFLSQRPLGGEGSVCPGRCNWIINIQGLEWTIMWECGCGNQGSYQRLWHVCKHQEARGETWVPKMLQKGDTSICFLPPLTFGISNRPLLSRLNEGTHAKAHG